MTRPAMVIPPPPLADPPLLPGSPASDAVMSRRPPLPSVVRCSLAGRGQPVLSMLPPLPPPVAQAGFRSASGPRCGPHEPPLPSPQAATRALQPTATRTTAEAAAEGPARQPVPQPARRHSRLPRNARPQLSLLAGVAHNTDEPLLLVTLVRRTVNHSGTFCGLS